jgi:formate/nitrite transporter FocA (FNT family)
MLGMLLPHEGMKIGLDGYAYNLALSTFGNIIGGAVFVAGLYWVGSPRAREQTHETAGVEVNGEAALVTAHARQGG